MSQKKDKYSLWIVPKGEAGEMIQALVNKLADENNSPRFVPHLTLVANIYASSAELDGMVSRVRQCTERLAPFVVKLTGYGYMEEEFRSLYLLADKAGIQPVYEVLTTQFPEVRDEHFQTLPHMSVLYGLYHQAIKDEIIATNPLVSTECMVDSFDLYLTNNPVESWQLAQSFKLLG